MANSIRVTSYSEKKIYFTIYQTPLVEDHQDPGLQREYTPVVPGGDGTELPASVALRLVKATEATKWMPATINDLGTDYLVAVKNGHGIAIRAHGATKGCQFKVKILAGGVNVASPPPFNSSSLVSSYPDYFLMPDQEWVFGVRVGQSSVRQFRMVKGESRFSLKSLYKRKEDESIEIQVTGLRRLQNVAPASVHSLPSVHSIHSVRDKNTPAGGRDIMSALSDFPGSEDAGTSVKPEQLGPGGRVHQDFAVDPDPEDWRTVGTHTMRFYLFDADHFKSKTGLDLNPINDPGRLHQVDSFVEDRFPAFRGRTAAVSIPSIAQLYRQFKREVQRGARNQDHAQNEQDPEQQGDMNGEIDHRERSVMPTQKQSGGKKFLSMLVCW